MDQMACQRRREDSADTVIIQQTIGQIQAEHALGSHARGCPQDCCTRSKRANQPGKDCTQNMQTRFNNIAENTGNTLCLHPRTTQKQKKNTSEVSFSSPLLSVLVKGGSQLGLIIPEMPRFEVFLPLLWLFCGFSPLPHLLGLGSHLQELFFRCVRGQRPQKMQATPL